MSTTRTTEIVSIRLANEADRAAVAELAAMDSARVPAEPVLVAEVDGVLRAARSLATGAQVADPFYPTDDIAALLVLRATEEPPRSLMRRIQERLLLWERLWARARPGHA
jgi:hypothetical protein